MLLKSGAGPNKATEDGMTPVHVAAKYGNLTTLVLLLEDGGDPLRKTKVPHYNDLCIKVSTYYFKKIYFLLFLTF